jgi:hypothetical protein
MPKNNDRKKTMGYHHIDYRPDLGRSVEASTVVAMPLGIQVEATARAQ